MDLIRYLNVSHVLHLLKFTTSENGKLLRGGLVIRGKKLRKLSVRNFFDPMKIYGKSNLRQRDGNSRSAFFPSILSVRVESVEDLASRARVKCAGTLTRVSMHPGSSSSAKCRDCICRGVSPGCVRVGITSRGRRRRFFANLRLGDGRRASRQHSILPLCRSPFLCRSAHASVGVRSHSVAPAIPALYRWSYDRCW